jgi:serine/threonine protein kinase
MTIEKAQFASLETILRPGQIVAGKYGVERLIGKGGMAAVWAGTNQRTGKRVALKVILRSFASSQDAEEMFRREALAASRVNHPNVVNVFDVVDHEGMMCIVMELLDGESLGLYLAKRESLAVEEAVTLLLPAMRGVAAANAQGIVHRDLKPQNLFICIGPDGRLLTTKVLDFGISLMLEKAIDASPETVITMHGTPAYMSPEHITNARDIDQRADVYGFGVLLFEALTKHLPFSGDPGPALLMRILNDPVPKASLFRPDLGSDVVEIIARAMAKNPDDRFPTLNEFIRALEEHCLPSLPLPRSLTPMVGVPLFDQPTTGTDPPLQLSRRSGFSDERGSNPTKALFLLPGERPMVDGESSRRLGSLNRTTETPATAIELVSWSMADRLKARGAGAFATAGAFVGALVVVGWLAMPRHHEQRMGATANPVAGAAVSAVAAPPAVVDVPQAPPKTASTSSRSTSPDRAASVAPMVIVKRPQPTPLAPKAADAMDSRRRPSKRKPSSRGQLPAEKSLILPLAPPPLAPSTPPAIPPPRAGVLTQDDF